MNKVENNPREAAGPASAIHVELSGEYPSMLNYTLPPPVRGEELRAAIRWCLRIQDAGPDAVTLPALCAPFRAPLNEVAGVGPNVFVFGETGSLKSSISGWICCFFGKFGFDELPGNFASTANATEKQQFLAKDVVLVLDDFKPVGTTSDRQRAHKGADQIFRGNANRAPRHRMQSDLRLRESFPARGMIVASGEEIPAGESLRARMVLLELTPGMLKLPKMIAFSQRREIQAQTMSSYLAWLAPQIDGLRAEVGPLRDLHTNALQEGEIEHARLPRNYADLMLGLDYFLRFALEKGAITAEESAALLARTIKTFKTMMAAQQLHIRVEHPGERALHLLRAVLRSGKAHIGYGVGGGYPFLESAKPFGGKRALGWHDEADPTPRSPCIGYTAPKPSGSLLLIPDAAFQAMNDMAQAQGGLGVSPTQLWKQWAERGVLVGTERTRGTMAVRKSVAGRRDHYIHVQLVGPDSGAPDEHDEDDTPRGNTTGLGS